MSIFIRKIRIYTSKQNQTIAEVMKELAVLELAGHAGDVLGDAYEYLISQFASDSGKKQANSIRHKRFQR